ncbi:hypothetical protein ACFSJY_04440 [Thalassotalea euphylliae]|uniref:hypothetical protein n=1 Tax=Thalassotalea euphylliae TaxID=1655234 RepID=UPI003626343D
MFQSIVNHSKTIISAVVIGVIITLLTTLILDYIYAETGPDEHHQPSDIAGSKAIPQLWSHHKILNMNAAECSNKGKTTLSNMKFTQVVQNDNYVYGNLSGNRAAIKCVALENKAFVYLAVAGRNVEDVEQLRNQIAWAF